MFYRPDGKAVCADVIPFYENGEFKLFYLKDFRDTEHCGEGCDWNLLTTSDLVHYVDHGTVLKRGTFDEQDLYVYTGCCNRFGDDYYIYYPPHQQRRGRVAVRVHADQRSDRLVAEYARQAHRGEHPLFQRGHRVLQGPVALRARREVQYAEEGYALDGSSPRGDAIRL